MKRNWTLTFAIMLGCACLPGRSLANQLDEMMQRTLKSNGLESEIIRSHREMEEKSPTGDGLFPFEINGTPGFKVTLDRPYWILKTWSAKKQDDVINYVFYPRDEQTSLTISLGEKFHERPDASLAMDPGFTFLAREAGTIAGQAIVWRHWSDQNHLFSDCTLRIAIQGAPSSRTYKVNVLVSANNVARRRALEECMAGLRLVPAAK